jgi:hypothetical protein
MLGFFFHFYYMINGKMVAPPYGWTTTQSLFQSRMAVEKRGTSDRMILSNNGEI